MIIAAFNPKGGVGKTTTVVTLGGVLAAMGRSVLVVDLEADLNTSISLGVRPADARPSVVDVLLHDVPASTAIRPVAGIANLHLLTGSAGLSQLEGALRHARQPERRLPDALRPLVPQFDVILLDSPSGFSLLATSVPRCADALVVPIRAEYLPLESLAQFLRWYRDRQETQPPLARLAGILLTMVDRRRQGTREVIGIIRRHSRDGVFRAEIPVDPRVPEAPSHGIPLTAYAPAARATIAYERFAAELLHRLHAHRG
jgi:chromosome partitioning protein